MKNLRRVSRARPFIESHSVGEISRRPLEELIEWRNRILNLDALKKLEAAIKIARRLFQNDKFIKPWLREPVLKSGTGIISSCAPASAWRQKHGAISSF